jgi:hypothetical protein
MTPRGQETAASVLQGLSGANAVASVPRAASRNSAGNFAVNVWSYGIIH